jgi:hypothetical protein
VVGRWTFSIGYILGTEIGIPQLRTFGFTLTIFVNVSLLELAFLGSSYNATLFLGL